uniref:Uncharacterized protein n=1 Tax=Nymphaea colorata TaxID=210225 RepID=A0A5K1H002_9MAGN
MAEFVSPSCECSQPISGMGSSYGRTPTSLFPGSCLGVIVLRFFFLAYFLSIHQQGKDDD